MARNLVDIINRIVAVAPDLEQILKSVREGVYYTAPEAMVYRWREVAFLLDTYAAAHPKREKISAIFSGRENN